MPCCGTPAMQDHLAEISATVERGAHAVLLLDQAGWHMLAKLNVPGNITLLPLSPRSPALNPQENIWQFLRDNWLSNRVVQSYHDILAHCCEACNKLTDQPWRIMPIGLRGQAHKFLSMSVGMNLRRSIRKEERSRCTDDAAATCPSRQRCSGLHARLRAITLCLKVEVISAEIVDIYVLKRDRVGAIRDHRVAARLA